MTHDIERHAQSLIHTSVQDALSSAHHASIPVLKRAMQLEDHRTAPRIALIRSLRTEINRKERQQAGAPKDAA